MCSRLFESSQRGRKGVALVIVLAFVVLLTILIVAFFSRAISEKQISTASSGQVKVDLLAEGALNSILGDLKQEIAAGSIVTSGTVAASGATYTICTPSSPWSMVPCVSGTIAGVPWLPPNVLKRSAAGQPFYSGTNYSTASNPIANNYITATITGTAVTSSTGSVIYPSITRAAIVASASALLSSTNPSLNGRSVSLARWNEPLLIPAISGAAATPQLSGTMADGTDWAYAAPDWILVQRSGGNPALGTALGALEWTPTNSTTVVGRYSYTVYDEGGLLNMNVAGHPSAVTGTTASVKSSLAMADLTQLGLGASQIDAIVTYWRNQATAQESGNFRDNMLQISAANGFLGVNPAVQGDSAFPSRQSLINFLLQNVSTSGSSRAQLQTALQYMGTFSRSLEEPSFSPNPNRPRIVNPASPPPAYTANDGYMGNNDAAGGDDLVNVPFLSVRATGAFTRMDGSIAQIGEPLVKKRFPLSRLAWITCAGPSATAPIAVQSALLNAGVSQVTINAGTAGNIYNAFGLTWTGTGTWIYNHGVKNNSSMLIIGKLTDAAAANREPDFLELLKAAIDVGSLAKAAPNLPGGGIGDYEYQYVLDSAVDYNVLQIAANLIDQVTPDSIPIIIQIQASSSSPIRSFRGIEDIPYFYRFHPFSVVAQAPSPLLSSGSTITLITGETVTSAFGNATVTTGSGAGALTFSDAAPGTLSQTGSAYLFYVPEVWNPHDANGDPDIQSPNTTLRPTAFRVTLDSADPGGITSFEDSAQVLPMTANTGTNGTSLTPGNGSQDPTEPTSPPAVLSSSSNSAVTMAFSDNNGQLFREPTLLWRVGYPVGSNLGLISGGVTATDPNTRLTYIGMPLGQCPVSVQVTVTGTVTGSGGYSSNGGPNPFIIQGRTINEGPTVWLGNPHSHMYTFRLQYQNPAVTGSNWITYDEDYADNHNLGTPNLVVNPADYPNALYENPLPGNIGNNGDNQLADTSGVIDPLTARFGVGLGYNELGETSTTGINTSFQQLSTGYVPEPSVSSKWSWSASAGASGSNFNVAVASSNFCIIESDRPRSDLGIYANLSSPCMCSDPGNNTQMRWFSGVGYYTPDSLGGVQNGVVGPFQFNGLLSQNNPAVMFQSAYGGEAARFYYEDPDGVARRAMGAYAETGLGTAASTVGLPEVTADSFPAVPGGNEGVPTPLATGQSQSRPIILNRPFRSVAEMSYASRGLPWRHIDFFTPESGDTALLDVFCVNELPANNMVAGKVDLNTRQPLVLQSILAGAYEDELQNRANPPAAGALSLSGTLSSQEATGVAQEQVVRTIDTVNYWHGPLANIGELVGRYVTTLPSISGSVSFNDPYTYLQPAFPPNPVYPPVASGKTIVYSGLSGALSASGSNGSMTSTLFVSDSNAALIQRGRESAIRPLVDCGQTRVWNLMIDVIAQTGRYPQGAGDLTKFQVEGEKRYWVHVAIDRYTGAIIDKQVEVVTE